MFSEGKPVALSANECTQVEIILRSSIDAYNVEQAKIFEETSQKYPDLQLQKYPFVIELERYYRQYIAIENDRGEKELWVNCFCAFGSTAWRDTVVFVKDGGNCFFNVKVNLTTVTYEAFTVNGNP